MRNLIAALFLILLGSLPAFSKVVVFWQDGFPTVDSQPVSREALAKALDGSSLIFAGIEDLQQPTTLTGADLLVLPYGSAIPTTPWDSIRSYLRGGGNLLVLGGQPFRVPIIQADRKFTQARPQDSYSREFWFRHAYGILPVTGAKFSWKPGYSFFPAPEIRARRFFAIEGSLEGLGYMVNAAGVQVAAPVIIADHTDATAPGSAMFGSRLVMLDFEPEAGYWDSKDGIALVQQAATYARQGATNFWLETLFSTLKRGEFPEVVVHLRNSRRERLGQPQSGKVKVELVSGSSVLDSADVPCSGSRVDVNLHFRRPLAPGFYLIRGTYVDAGQAREFYQNGFWVEDEALLTSGPVLGVHGDFLTRDGKPFFPVGTNYFTTESQDWDFSGPRNAWTWEKDFAEMAQHGVTFVRTGVWMPFMRFVEPATDQVNERFLRNLEAFLLCARRHNIVVNFTFFAFAPRFREHGPGGDLSTPGPNPYTDPASIRGEQDYVLSVVSRFKKIPWLCWDLINEPSFSNPRRLWKGNTPNGDPTELAAWHTWLREKYENLETLAAGWAVAPEELGSFDGIPLPSQDDLAFDRYGNAAHVRAVDYNLFAQDMFIAWVRAMVDAIRAAGSTQLINIGQDEGGVTDRVLNQFYASGGVSFTTNHTYWRDDALLWDSVVAKRPGVPNIVGETGYQPVWAPDGAWRYDELTGFSLLERKWALGFAAGNSGALQWDWAREVDFGMKRSDGSAKSWQFMMRDLGQFAEKAAPLATELVQPQVAIVLPQSFQLSVWNAMALEAQQKSVRALYQYARSEAYAVGEYQIPLIGDPKLIILPSPFGFADNAWQVILGKVCGGATLLVTGLFDGDPHFHPTGRQKDVDLDYTYGLLGIRENRMQWAGGDVRVTYSGDKTTYVNRAILPEDRTWAETTVGKGKVLFAPLPLELNDNLAAVGDVYRYALKAAGVVPTYTTEVDDPGILICPTRFPHATLYVLTSETDQKRVSFRDQPSGKQFSGSLDPGRAALLLIGDNGAVIAAYNWKPD